MVLKRMEGFERRNGVVHGFARYATTRNIAYVSPGPTGTGSYAWSEGQTFNFPNINVDAGFSGPQIACGMRVMFSGSSNVWNNFAPIYIAEGLSIHLCIGRDSTTGQAVLLRGPSQTVSTGVELGRSENPVPDKNVWNYWEIEAYIHATAGWAKVYINEELIIEVSGVNTKNGAVGLLGNITKFGVQGNNGTDKVINLDDCYACDPTGPPPFNTVLGDITIEGLIPNGNGDESDWMGSDADKVNNYQLVDDLSSTDYVYSQVPTERDMYEFGNVPANSGAILAVEVNALVVKSDAGTSPGDLREVIKSQTGTLVTNVIATPAQISTTPQWVAGIPHITDPDGTNWTLEDVDAIQAGIELSL